MKNILTIALGISLLYSCTETNENKTIPIAADNPAERVVWEQIRLIDPSTGSIPRDIRRKEMMFAKTLPKSTALSKANWVHRGPYNVGGRTRALAMDVLDENILFAGGVTGGMYRSTDGGQSWDLTTDPSQLHNVTCISQDKRPGKENVWYFGSGENRGGWLGDVSFLGNGIFKSVDGGLSWDSIPVTMSNTPQSVDHDFDFIWNIVTDQSNDSLDVVYAATHGDIYRSEDGGASWSKQLGGQNIYYYQYTNVAITTTGVVYAAIASNCADKGIWRSPDGQNWTKIIDANFPPVYDRIAIAINPSDENEVYFLAASTDNYGQHTDVFFGGETWTSLWKYNYLSGDGSGTGGQWTDLSMSIPANQATSFDNFNSQSSYDLMIKVHPTDPNLVYIGGTNLWRSTDGFSTPNNTMICGGYLIGSYEGDGNWGIYPNHHPDQHDLLFLPSDNNVMLSATDGGVFKSLDTYADTVEWTSLNNGYYTTQLYAATVSKNANSDVLHGGFQDNGNFITFNGDPNTHWSMPFNGDGAFAGIADNEEDFYLTIQRGVMYKMKLDTNANRLAFNRMDPISCDSTKYMFINPMVMDKNSDNIIYWAEGNQLWRNNELSNIPYNNSHAKSDQGWHAFSDTLPSNSMKISVIKTSVNPPNIVYYGTQNKYIYRVDNAHVGDPAHNKISNIQTGTNSYCSDIAIHPDNADEILMVYSNYSVYSLFHSTDGGANFTKVAGNLEQNSSGSGNGPSCRTAAIIPLGNDTLYLVGTSVGLFGTAHLNGDNTVWEQIGAQAVGNVIIEQITFRDADNLLVVATYGGGIYTTHINSIGDVFSAENNAATSFEFNVYPNPTTDQITLSVTTDKATDIHWKLYDELGRIVKQSATKQHNFGANTICIQTSDLKTGIYFISLKTDNTIITKEIIKQ